MKSLSEFINESSNISESSESYEVQMNKRAVREVPKRIRFDEDMDKYVNAINKAIRYMGYVAYEAPSGYGIEIYQKGARKAMKNLKAAVIANDYIDFGPNADLVKQLAGPIFKAIDEAE